MDLHLQPKNPMSQDSDTDTETSQKLQTQYLTKALSLSTTNGSLKSHHHHPPPHQPPQAAAAAVSYKECLKNHAAKLGGLALDGCGEFMPTPTATLHDPSTLKCAACGCHRNFHRRDPTITPPLLVPLSWAPSPSSGPTSPTTATTTSPTPLHDHSSPYQNYPSWPHRLMGLAHLEHKSSYQPGVKRPRTKLTQDQKLKMHTFAEKLGWKMVRGIDEKMVQEFCNEVGVRRNVLKVWMHNNKHRKEKGTTNYTITVNSSIETNVNEGLQVPS